MQTSYSYIPNRPGFPEHRITRRLEIFTKDALTLRGWQLAAAGSAKGNVVIIHGFKDYSERYLDFATELSNNGYQVFAYDQRGHARSDGDRVYFPDFDIVTHDLLLAMQVFKRYDNQKPWIILGHSIGASVAARYALLHDDELAGLIMSAPALKKMPELQGLIASALKTANFFVPHFGIIDLPNEKFSRDPDIVNKMNNDMLITNKKIPARSGVSALENMEYIQENKSKAKIPFLILHGSYDQINNIEGSREFFEETPNIPGKDLKIYPGLAHDLLHEPEHSIVEKDIINWINLISTRKNINRDLLA